MWTVVLILLRLLILGGLPPVGLHPYGYWPSGTLSLVLIIVVILVVTGRL